jgi:hypothetical protein
MSKCSPGSSAYKHLTQKCNALTVVNQCNWNRDTVELYMARYKYITAQGTGEWFLFSTGGTMEPRYCQLL